MSSASHLPRAFSNNPHHIESYSVSNSVPHRAAVIDPLLDYDATTGEVDTGPLETLFQEEDMASLIIQHVQRAYAPDHWSGASYIEQRTGARIAISGPGRIAHWISCPMVKTGEVKADGGDFVRLSYEDEGIRIGTLDAEVLHAAGRMPTDIAVKFVSPASSSTGCSSPTTARPILPFTAAIRIGFPTKSTARARFRLKRDCSFARTTKPGVGFTTHRRFRSPNNGPTTNMAVVASHVASSSP